MNIQINNTRELKSLYLLKNIRKLELFFKNPISCGVFVTCATLQPNLRIDTNEKFLTNNLKINKVSNKLIKIIFQDFSKEIVKNLLSGPIYLIEDDLNDLLSHNKLNTILQYKNFTFRFFYINQQLYRSEEIFPLLEAKNLSLKDTIFTLKNKKILLF